MGLVKMTTSTKNKKQRSQNQQKALLARRINELGFDGVLYPNTNAERHPYTQEVIIMAMGQDIKQDELRRLCGVSQPQISQWANGSGLATMKQLAGLLPKLKNTAPGSAFHQLKVVKKTAIELPENWEQECFLAYFKSEVSKTMTRELLDDICQPIRERLDQNNYGYLRSREYECYWGTKLNLELLKQSVYGQLEQEQSAQRNNMESNHKDQLGALQSELVTLKEQKQQAEAEAQENQQHQTEHQALIQQFYDERPALANVDEETKRSLAFHEYPEPSPCEEASHELSVLLDNYATEYAVNLDYSSIKNAVEQKIETLVTQHGTDMAALNQVQKKELEEKTIFGKYNVAAFSPILEVSSSLELMNSVIVQKAADLYDAVSFDLIVSMRGIIKDSYDRNKYDFNHNENIELNPKKAFIDYCGNLPVNYVYELVQISGEIIFSSRDKFTCYRLYSNKLLINHRDEDGQDYIYVEDDADAAINTARTLNKLHDIDSNLEESLKKVLIEQGYLLSDIRTIY